MNNYQVGGSLKLDNSTYVTRKADEQLYQALLQGEFCYVFNCRQMGKSSLRVRVKKRLEQQGYACVSLDMTNIGSQQIAPQQWYKSLASEIWRGLGLMSKVMLKPWWQEHSELSPLQQFHLFITDVVLHYVEAPKIVILIDEIDSVLSLNFTTDDFFALIRYFYNFRTENPEFNRLAFALFGVATPSDLIRDRLRTPFNIGTAIELTGFTLEEAMPLVAGLAGKFKNPQLVLTEILNWTGGQPFLTQKLCQLAVYRSQEQDACILPGKEIEIVKNLVTEKIIDNWEVQDEPEHLKTIRDRLLRNEQKASRLLGLAIAIFRQGFVAVDDSAEQRDLLLSNLAVKKSEHLIYRNPIYQKIFNLDWLEAQLDRLRPFSKELAFWLASQGQDSSRLLRGKTLADALAWADHHSLNPEEYQFLSASQKLEQEGIRQRLELSRLKAIETKLIQEQKLANTQRFLLGTIGAALAVTTLLGIFAWEKYLQAIINEIEALSSFSQALYISDRRFEALLKAIEARQKNQGLVQNQTTDSLTESTLRQAVYGVLEYNSLQASPGVVFAVAISPDNQLLASGGENKLVQVWQADGKLLYTLKGHQARIWSVKFSPDGKYIASASRDRTLKIWDLKGNLISNLQGHQDAVLGLTFSPDGKYIASASRDRTLKIWDLKGNLVNSIQAHQDEIQDLAYSPDGQTLVSVSSDRQIKFWQVSLQGQINPQAKITIPTTDRIRAVAYSPNGQLVAVASDDHQIRLFSSNGKLIAILSGHQDVVSDLEFSSDGQTITSVSWDRTIRIWRINGKLLQIIADHSQRIWGLALSQDSQTIATAADRYGVKLWRPNNPLLKIMREHQAAVIDVAHHPHHPLIISASDDKTINFTDHFGNSLTTLHSTAGVLGIAYSPDGEILVSGHNNGQVKLWHTDPQQPTKITQTQILSGHTALVWRVAFHPEGKVFATASEDGSLKLWNRQGKLQRTLLGHSDGVKTVAFSPDGRLIASGGLDGKIIIWRSDGKLLATLTEHQSAVVGLSFNPQIETVANRSSYLLASASWDNSAILWDIQQDTANSVTATARNKLLSHEDSLRAVNFSPDGQAIATASQDNSIKLWNLHGELLKTLFGHDAAVWQVFFAPYGDKIISSSEDRTVIVWNLERINNLDLLTYGCDWVRDYLKYHHSSNPTFCDL